jgi:peptidoglycan/LPS O-acetylase OafA/YrhL
MFFPNSWIWAALTIFPVTAPMMTMLRLGTSIVPTWQIVASITVLVLSIVGGLSLSIRLFRMHMLMYGKRPGLKQLVQNLKEARLEEQRASLEAAQRFAAQGAARKRTHLHFIDSLRLALAILVVVHHVSLVYGVSVPDFYYVEPPFVAPGIVDPLAYAALMVFALLNQGWFMGAFFLLAGYFVPGSYDRKGPGSFVTGKLVRLGVPLALFYFVLNPISRLGWWLMPAELTGITSRPSWGAYSHMVGVGPLWFVILLFAFSLGYAVWRMLTGKRTASSTSEPSETREQGPSHLGPSYLGTGIFVLALAGVSYLLRRAIPIGQAVWEFLTLAYLPQYLSLFVAGIVAYRRNWFRTVSNSMGVVGLVAALVATVVLFPLAFSGRLFSLELTEAMTLAMGGGHWRSAVYALWDSIFAVGLCLGSITVFRRFLDRESRFGRFLARQSYAVYILHIPVIVFLAWALRGLALPALLKFVVASVVIVPASFVVAALVRKIPGLSRIL